MFGKIQSLLPAVLVLVFGPVGMASAQYTSPNYKINELFFGAGGELSAMSPSYQAKIALGELGVDHASSANFQVYSGFNTTDRPILEVAVTGGTFNFGVLSTSQASAITAVFTVRSYLSSGYTVQPGGTAPKNNSGPGHALNRIDPAGNSNPGFEQFGINLAANNLPVVGAFGSDPVQVPDLTFGFGQAATDYATSNSFKYLENDIIAQSTKSSGVTQYTLSAIANISKTTPGGFYGTSIFINVVPTF